MSGLLSIGCGRQEAPVTTDSATVQAESQHRFGVTSFIIPRGIFRGALWPSSSRGSFRLWVTIRGETRTLEIATPESFGPYEADVTKAWRVQPIPASYEGQLRFSMARHDGSVKFRLSLPQKQRPYSFWFLKNEEGNEICVFMDIAEQIVDEGLFGYVVIDSK